MCSKGTLGENELVGNRTDMFAAEIVRSTGQQLAAEDKTVAAAFKLTLEMAKASLSRRMGEQASPLLTSRWRWTWLKHAQLMHEREGKPSACTFPFKLTQDLGKASLSKGMGEKARPLLACFLRMAKLPSDSLHLTAVR